MQKEDDINMKLWKKSLAGLIGAALLVIVAVHVVREWKQPPQNQQNGDDSNE